MTNLQRNRQNNNQERLKVAIKVNLPGDTKSTFSAISNQLGESESLYIWSNCTFGEKVAETKA